MSKVAKRGTAAGGGGGGHGQDTETSRLVPNQRSSQSSGGTFSGTKGPTQHHHHHHHAHGGAHAHHPFPSAHHHHYPEAATNPLECMIKRALTGYAFFLALTFLGILLVVLKALGFDAMPAIAQLPPAARSYWVVFAPFWAADLVGWVVVAQTLANTCSLRTTGASRDERQHNVARVAPGTKGRRVIGPEMLPLVQIVVRSLVAAVPFLLCLTTTQVLLCACLQGNARVPLWLGLLPMVIWEALALLATLCLRTGSFLKALGWCLALLATVTLGLRFSTPPAVENPWPFTTAEDAPLWLAFTPFWALLGLGLLTLLHLSLQSCCVRRYRLTSQHVACLVLYAASLALLALATVLVAWRDEKWEAALDHALHFQNFTETLAGIAVFSGVGLAELALYLVAAEEADHLATSQGYEEPMPLSRTARGWEPTGSRVTAWSLLGRVEETARLTRRRGVARTVGGVAGAGMRMAGMAGAAAKGAIQRNASPLHGMAGGGSGEGGELRRSNSGSYADLYDDL